MNDIPKDEAQRLLGAQLKCENCDEWTPLKVQPGSFSIENGLVDLSGKGTQLYVQLDYRKSLSTRSTKYIFTVFKRQPYGRDRVYQLEIIQASRLIKDLHRRSHEHFGNERSIGGADWNEWGYDDVLRYFSARTNIEFAPEPPHPEIFQLKG